MANIGRKRLYSHFVFLGALYVLASLTFAMPTLDAMPECLIPPASDPGIGGVYFCPPAEGERYLIAHARRGQTEAGLTEDIWVNFRGVFRNRVWVNIGLQESSDASLPAWDALASLVEWMQAIKAGEPEALEAFLAPLEISTTYTRVDIALQKRLLYELKATASLPKEGSLRVILYHVHLMSPSNFIASRSTPLNPQLSIPSREDLLLAQRLNGLAPGSESKIAVPAGIWTYTWDQAQATRFVSETYDGPPEAPFPLKYEHVYMRYAMSEYLKQGLNKPSGLTPERLHEYTKTLRPTGAILSFTFSTDWTTIQQDAVSD